MIVKLIIALGCYCSVI